MKWLLFLILGFFGVTTMPFYKRKIFPSTAHTVYRASTLVQKPALSYLRSTKNFPKRGFFSSWSRSPFTKIGGSQKKWFSGSPIRSFGTQPSLRNPSHFSKYAKWLGIGTGVGILGLGARQYSKYTSDREKRREERALRKEEAREIIKTIVSNTDIEHLYWHLDHLDRRIKSVGDDQFSAYYIDELYNQSVSEEQLSRLYLRTIPNMEDLLYSLVFTATPAQYEKLARILERYQYKNYGSNPGIRKYFLERGLI